MSGSELLGLSMLLVMLGAIFIGLPISFTLLFLALTFGYFGLGHVVFDLAYFQTISRTGKTVDKGVLRRLARTERIKPTVTRAPGP